MVNLLKISTVIFYHFMLILAAFGLFPQSIVKAQSQPSVKLEIQPRSGSINDTYDMTIVVSGSQNTESPKLKGGGDFEVIGRDVQSVASFDSSNISVKRIYSFSLQPKRIGVLSSPFGRIDVDGETYNFDPLKIRVSAVSKALEQSNKSVMVVQRLNKKDVYIGEQVLNTIEIMSRIRLYDFEIETPNYEGFWTEVLGSDQTGRRRIAGVNYDAYRINRALYPLRVGKVTLPERTISASIRDAKSMQRGGLNFGFEIFNLGPKKKIELSSNVLEINVQEVPTPPKDFPTWNLLQTVVGETEIRLAYSPRNISVGESKTLIFEIISRGNINPIKSIPIPQLDNIKIYKEQPENSHFDEAGMLVMKKRFSISLVPSKVGQVEVPPITLGYFNPEKKRYEIAKTKTISFSVNSTSSGETQVSNLTPTAETPLPQGQNQGQDTKVDPLLIYSEKTLVEKFSEKISSAMFILSLGVVLLLCLITWLFLKIYFAGKKRRALTQQIHNASNTTELKNAFQEMLSQHLKIDPENLHNDQLKATIKNDIPNSELRFNIQLLMDEFDSQLYGNTSENSSVIELKEKLEQVLRNWQ